MPQDISIPSDPLVWLLWFVLAGVGAFLLKVGLSLVESIKSNTVAVVSLTGKIEKLCEQQAAANALVHSQMGAHMNTIQREFDGLKGRSGMFGDYEGEKTMDQLLRTLEGKRWTQIAFRWWVWVVAWFASCSFAIIVWTGTGTRDLTFEQLLDGVRGKENPEAAIITLQARILEALQVIRQREEEGTRAAALAKSAILRVHKETERK